MKPTQYKKCEITRSKYSILRYNNSYGSTNVNVAVISNIYDQITKRHINPEHEV